MQIRQLTLLGVILALAAPAWAQSQRMAIPSYIYPGDAWTKIDAGAPTVGLAIINPASGPGAKVDPAYLAQVKASQKSGLIVLCYVDTNYTKRDASLVASEIHEAFTWYGVNGIMLDEVTNDAAHVDYYLHCRKLIKSLNPKALVVLNPGTQVDESYLQAGDIICTFESDYSDYQNKYSAPTWVTKYPARRFWHIILNVPTNAEMLNVVAETKQRHAGWVYVTSATLPNPYDTLPAEKYWSDEIMALSH